MNAKMPSEKEILDYWVNFANTKLAGRTIVKARYMTKRELKKIDWPRSPLVLELDDGSLLYPSSDDEGNRAGALFGRSPKQSATTGASDPTIPSQ